MKNRQKKLNFFNEFTIDSVHFNCFDRKHKRMWFRFISCRSFYNNCWLCSFWIDIILWGFRSFPDNCIMNHCLLIYELIPYNFRSHSNRIHCHLLTRQFIGSGHFCHSIFLINVKTCNFISVCATKMHQYVKCMVYFRDQWHLSNAEMNHFQTANDK